MSDHELLARVREALERTDVMALSTIDDDGGPWTSPVQFEWNARLHLAFLSMADARHVANIRRDPRVSVAVYAVPGPPGGNVGLQVRGTAQSADSSSATEWQRFRITPVEVWLFDSRVDRERHVVDMSGLDLLSDR